MGIEALERLQGLRESEVPYPAGYDLGINPEGRVVTENPCFPERNGRGRSDSAPEIAASTDPLSRQP